jgi:hypothetical protein
LALSAALGAPLQAARRRQTRVRRPKVLIVFIVVFLRHSVEFT